jgi:hypothetical protein
MRMMTNSSIQRSFTEKMKTRLSIQWEGTWTTKMRETILSETYMNEGFEGSQKQKKTPGTWPNSIPLLHFDGREHENKKTCP